MVLVLPLSQSRHASMSVGACALKKRMPSGPMTASPLPDRKSTRLNSSHLVISYAVFCLKKKNCDNNKWSHHYLLLNLSVHLPRADNFFIHWDSRILILSMLYSHLHSCVRDQHAKAHSPV